MNEKGGISSLSRIEQWRRKKEEKNKKYDEKNRHIFYIKSSPLNEGIV